MTTTASSAQSSGPAKYTDQRDLLESLIAKWFEELKAEVKPADWTQGLQTLWESMKYSLSQSGKRTRPVLGLLLAEQLGVDPRKMIPWVMSVEMVHTYSLIHDDLPSMDNDDVRRGQPTNHKVFGEATALLAGDTLLTEAFGLIANNYQQDSGQALRAVSLLSEGAGFLGMAGGQAMDLLSKGQKFSLDETKTLHQMKTGALFRTICEGVGVLCGTPVQTSLLLREFGASLGFAFQLSDDLLDSAQKIEAGSFPSLIGMEKTKALLDQETENCLTLLKKIGIQSGPLPEIVKWNQERKI